MKRREEIGESWRAKITKMMLPRVLAFGTDPWDPTNRFFTSWLISPYVLAALRGLFVSFILSIPFAFGVGVGLVVAFKLEGFKLVQDCTRRYLEHGT